MMATWVSFQIEDRRRGAKTDVWHVWSLKLPAAHLGIVKWFPTWRRYAFFPGAETLFDGTCLRDIAAFVESETEKQRKGRRAFSE